MYILLRILENYQCHYKEMLFQQGNLDSSNRKKRKGERKKKSRVALWGRGDHEKKKNDEKSLVENPMFEICCLCSIR